MNCDEKLVVLVFVFVGGSRWWVAGDRRERRDSLATRLSKRVYLSCDQKVDVVRVLRKRCKGSGSGSGERHHYLQVDKSGSGWYSDGRTWIQDCERAVLGNAGGAKHKTQLANHRVRAVWACISVTLRWRLHRHAPIDLEFASELPARGALDNAASSCCSSPDRAAPVSEIWLRLSSTYHLARVRRMYEYASSTWILSSPKQYHGPCFSLCQGVSTFQQQVLESGCFKAATYQLLCRHGLATCLRGKGRQYIVLYMTQRWDGSETMCLRISVALHGQGLKTD